MLRFLPLIAALFVWIGCSESGPVDVLDASTSPAAQNAAFPDVIPLPDGFRPEGIVVGSGTTFYVGSLFDGSIYRGDLRTGSGELLTDTAPGASAVGLAYDARTGYLYVAGGDFGTVRVHDTATGDLVETFTGPGAGFLNDLVVTRTAVYVTDSFTSTLYVLPLDPDGTPSTDTELEALPLGGDFAFVAGFNANGIDATRDGRTLFIVQSNTGIVYTVDPETGEATALDLGGETVPNGDGILLSGRTLYVVQNQLDQIAEIELAPDLSSGEVVDVLTSPNFDIPTTIDRFGNALYAVNARFTTPPTPDTEYDVVRVPL